MRKRSSLARKIVWGVFLMGAAALVITNALYSFTTFFPLLLGIILLPIIVESIISLNFSGLFIPVALLGIVFAEPLGIESITPWPILAAAVLLSIGFHVMFGKRFQRFAKTDWDEKGSTENFTNDEVNCTVKFGGGTKYIQSENLERVYLNCTFGGIKVYLDNATLSPDGATLYIDAQFSGIELYIPRHWKVVKDVTAIFGAIDEKTRNAANDDSPTLIISGNAKCTGITVYYV